MCYEVINFKNLTKKNEKIYLITGGTGSFERHKKLIQQNKNYLD